MRPDRVRLPLPVNELTVFAGVFSAVDIVAAGFWRISMHEVGLPAAQLFPTRNWNSAGLPCEAVFRNCDLHARAAAAVRRGRVKRTSWKGCICARIDENNCGDFPLVSAATWNSRRELSRCARGTVKRAA